MTVQDLIDVLREFPPQMDIVGCTDECAYPREGILVDEGHWNEHSEQWVDIDDGIKFVGSTELVRLWID